jgi:uridine kinase
VHPRPIIIIEGILVLAIPEIVQYADACVYVDAPADIRLCRRLRRDVLERKRNVDSVLEQYLNTVRPMHEKHIEPSMKNAQLLLDGTVPIAKSVEKLDAFINDLKKNQ